MKYTIQSNVNGVFMEIWVNWEIWCLMEWALGASFTDKDYLHQNWFEAQLNNYISSLLQDLII